MHFGRSRRPAFTGVPHPCHRTARRPGAGWPVPQVARVLKCDPMDLPTLLREEAFAELFRAHDELRRLPVEERLARLEEVAPVLLEEAVAGGDLRVAWFVVRERGLGHDPASSFDPLCPAGTDGGPWGGRGRTRARGRATPGHLETRGWTRGYATGRGRGRGLVAGVDVAAAGRRG